MPPRKLSKEEQAYEDLRLKMMGTAQLIGISMQRSPTFSKLMKTFFPTVEHVEVVMPLPISPKNKRAGKTVMEVAKELDKDPARIQQLLDELVLTTGAWRRERPGEPGVMEYSLSYGGEIGDTVGVIDAGGPIGIAYGEVWSKYYDEGHFQEWSASKYPLFRVLLPDEHLDPKAKVESWELASEVIKAVDYIAIAYCACRIRSRGRKYCNHRLDCCFLFGDFGRETVEHSKHYPLARPVERATTEQALQVLQECLKEGLVAAMSNNTDIKNAGAICMCCGDGCCHMLSAYSVNTTGWGNPYGIAKSNFQQKIDRETCVPCRICADVCPVKALWHHYPHKADLSDDFIFLEEDRCIGCGVCAMNCPRGSITMVKVRDERPEPDRAAANARRSREMRH